MIKGTMMAAHVKWATTDRAAPDLLRFWNALPPEVAKPLKSMILPVTFYEFAHLIAVDHAIVKAYAGGDIRVLRDVGAYSARVNLTGVYKVYRRDSIHAFLEGSARMHLKFQDFGVAAYARTGPTSGDMLLSEYCSYSPLFCESAIGFYREALAIHGGQSVHVNETSCQCFGEPRCTFAISWQ
jgi:hypothetical protein